MVVVVVVLVLLLVLLLLLLAIVVVGGGGGGGVWCWWCMVLRVYEELSIEWQRGGLRNAEIHGGIIYDQYRNKASETISSLMGQTQHTILTQHSLQRDHHSAYHTALLAPTFQLFSIQHSMTNQSAFSIQHSAFNVQHSTFNIPAFNIQHSAFQHSSIQHSSIQPTFNGQRSGIGTPALSVQYSIFSIQHSAVSIQHSTFNLTFRHSDHRLLN
jgi:hypothetical protein